MHYGCGIIFVDFKKNSLPTYKSLNATAMKNFHLTLFILLFASVCFAQKNRLGANIKVYSPISKFKENINSAIPVGISLNYLRLSEVSRFSFGGELGIAMYSSEEYTIDRDGEQLEVNEEDCFWTIHGVVRYDLYRTEKMVTYAEGRIGATTFFSASSTSRPGEKHSENNSKLHGTAFNTGLGGGILYQVFDNLWINAGVNLHSGNTADYRYIPESEGTTAPTLKDGDHQSLTHYVGYRLGVSVDL